MLFNAKLVDRSFLVRLYLWRRLRLNQSRFRICLLLGILSILRLILCFIICNCSLFFFYRNWRWINNFHWFFNIKSLILRIETLWLDLNYFFIWFNIFILLNSYRSVSIFFFDWRLFQFSSFFYFFKRCFHGRLLNNCRLSRVAGTLNKSK